MEKETTKTALFVGGDVRSIYAAKALIRMGFDARFAAKDARKARLALAEAGAPEIPAEPLFEALGSLCRSGGSGGNSGDSGALDGDSSPGGGTLDGGSTVGGAVILPVPVCRDGVNIADSLFCEKTPVAAILSALSPGTRVFCGMATAAVADAARDARVELTDYYADESFLVANAALTAEGALAELIRLSPRALLRSRAVVFGYGRCASQLARRLVALGSRVTVVARSAEKRALAEADGAAAISPSDAVKACANADFAVNTVPAPVIGAREAAALAGNGAFVLELASRSGLSPDAAGLVRVVAAPGLPGRYSPEAAGEFVAASVAASLPLR